MKHLTKIFVGLAIVLFIVGYYLQATDHDSLKIIASSNYVHDLLLSIDITSVKK
nr:hypothetical protein KUHPSE09_09330 [Staphylococcus epidermidis]